MCLGRRAMGTNGERRNRFAPSGSVRLKLPGPCPGRAGAARVTVVGGAAWGGAGSQNLRGLGRHRTPVSAWRWVTSSPRERGGMTTSKKSVVLYLCRRDAVDARDWKDWTEGAAMTASSGASFPAIEDEVGGSVVVRGGGRSRRIPPPSDWTKILEASLDGTRECLPASAKGPVVLASTVNTERAHQTDDAPAYTEARPLADANSANTCTGHTVRVPGFADSRCIPRGEDEGEAWAFLSFPSALP
ncbi:hypothetical protein QBC39DRAFT_45967 [Podospora conica]|nr:hypothetical protein QBC39DRAFT_45967 [Schizothecium conicum]